MAASRHCPVHFSGGGSPNNFTSTSSRRASTSWGASAPSALILSFVPTVAASILICIMLFPSASVWPLLTVTAHLNRFAISTNCIAGRMCSPSAFFISTSVSQTGVSKTSFPFPAVHANRPTLPPPQWGYSEGFSSASLKRSSICPAV